MNVTVPFLFAAGWLETVVAGVFIALWLLGQFAEIRKKAAPRPKPREPKQPQPEPVAAGQRAGQPAQAQGADPLRQQVEDFLRRAGKREQPAPGGPRPAPVAAGPKQREPVEEEVEILLVDEPQQPPRRPVSRPLDEGKRVAQAGAPKPPRPPRKVPTHPDYESVAEHVADHITSGLRSFDRRATHLGEEVALADDKLEARIHQTFDHQLGKLTSQRAEDQQPAAPADNPAAQIAAMLASPEGMRQAVVLQEILRRPELRW